MHRSSRRAVPKQPGVSATGKTPLLFLFVHFSSQSCLRVRRARVLVSVSRERVPDDFFFSTRSASFPRFLQAHPQNFSAGLAQVLGVGPSGGVTPRAAEAPAPSGTYLF
jgi:hypothetical protein